MDKVLRIVGPILALGLVGLFAWVVVRGALAEPAIVGSLLTVFGAIGVVAYQQWLQRRDAMKEARREQLSPMYDSLTKLVRTIGKAPARRDSVRPRRPSGHSKTSS